MQKQVDHLKRSPQYIKSCILYEVLDKKPVFRSYRNFCKKLGNDVMEYMDFEFWYFRFYNGDLDFDYDRSNDPKPKGLMELSGEFLDNIIGQLDPIERASVRKMNKTLKEICDRQPPKFENIDLMASDTAVYWRLNKEKFECKKKRKNCVLQKREGIEKPMDGNYMETGLKMFENIMRTPELEVENLSLNSFGDDASFVKCIPEGLPVKSLKVTAREFSHAQTILSLVQPGILATLELEAMGKFDATTTNLFEMDQWKQAKNVSLRYGRLFNMNQITTEFLKFESFKICASIKLPGDIIRIRDILPTAPHFKNCKLHVFLKDKDILAIAEAIGGIDVEGEDERLTIRHYPLPGTNEMLKFAISRFAIGIERMKMTA